MAIIPETPVASPSKPSVKLAALDTPVTIKITTGIKINQIQNLLACALIGIKAA